MCVTGEFVGEVGKAEPRARISGGSIVSRACDLSSVLSSSSSSFYQYAAISSFHPSTIDPAQFRARKKAKKIGLTWRKYCVVMN